jgi:hypothetical protein
MCEVGPSCLCLGLSSAHPCACALQYQPGRVYLYLKSQEGYRVEPMLELAQRHQLPDAVAWLLEQNGEYQQAFSLIRQVCQEYTPWPACSSSCVACAGAACAIGQDEHGLSESGQRVWYAALLYTLATHADSRS